MWDKFIHKILHIPYVLNVVEFSTPKKPLATIIFIHGIGSSSKMWTKMAKQLPGTVRCIGVDLLGFGESPKPSWKPYSAKTQADSVLATLIRLNIRGPVIVVGHSLGALVAVEFTKRYKYKVKKLILCSPPFYRPVSSKTLVAQPEQLLRTIYKTVQNNPKNSKKLLKFISKYNYLNAGFKVDDTTFASYLASLEAAIVNQSSLEDAVKIKKPIEIFSGHFDVLVVDTNIRYLQKHGHNITLTFLAAGHEVAGRYRIKVQKSIENTINDIASGRKKKLLQTRTSK